MSLAERLSQKAINPARQWCTVGALLSELEKGENGGEGPGTEWNAFAGALSTPGWSAVQIARACEDEGHTVSVRHIREHRQGHTASVCASHKIGVLRASNPEILPA